MSHTARILSAEVLEELRQALLNFGDAAARALETVAGDVTRTERWLEENLALWQAEVRRCENELFLAKEELARRRMMKVGGRPVDCSDQEKALRRAQAALEHAEDKVGVTRHWIRDLPDELTEYEGPARSLQHLLDNRLPRGCALLQEKLRAIDAYIQTEAPRSPAPPPTPTSRGGTTP